MTNIECLDCEHGEYSEYTSMRMCKITKAPAWMSYKERECVLSEESINSDNVGLDAVEALKEARNAESDKDINLMEEETPCEGCKVTDEDRIDCADCLVPRDSDIKRTST